MSAASGLRPQPTSGRGRADARLVAGIDVGSASTKCVLLDEMGAVRGTGLTRTLPGFEAVAHAALEAALSAAAASREDVIYTATTGLGRASIPWRQIQITDVTCAARGAHRLLPEARFVLDMGAQTTRAIRLRDHGRPSPAGGGGLEEPEATKSWGGRVAEFHMNEKCAAGSGGFIERAARSLEVAIGDVGDLSLRSKAPRGISSVCAVLAESEIINHVSEGCAVEDILRGIHQSLAERAKAQLRRVGLGPSPGSGKGVPRPEGVGPDARGAEGDEVMGRGPPVAVVGGVARQAGMIAAFREALGVGVLVPERPELAAALGAAILGWQRVRRAREGRQAPAAL